MPFPIPYVLFPGTARSALAFYQQVFGGQLELFNYAQFNRVDGPDHAIAHGMLQGEVSLYAADAAPGGESVQFRGLMLSILGATPEQSRQWFEQLAVDGAVIDPLQQRPWGDWDGQVRDRHGLVWLIGFKNA